jgi:hypothetical protein
MLPLQLPERAAESRIIPDFFNRADALSNVVPRAALRRGIGKGG